MITIQSDSHTTHAHIINVVSVVEISSHINRHVLAYDAWYLEFIIHTRTHARTHTHTHTMNS